MIRSRVNECHPSIIDKLSMHSPRPKSGGLKCGATTLTVTGNQAPAAATFTFSPAAGTYMSAQTVTINDTTPGSVIYFSTDGSTPTTSPPKYTAPIIVSATQRIEAIAYGEWFLDQRRGHGNLHDQPASAKLRHSGPWC